MRQIVLDTETTGLSPENGDRILEIGCVEILDRKITKNSLHLYINPQRASHEDAFRIHGISEEFLRDKPVFAEIVEELLAYLQNDELIIHNAAFDVAFLNKEFALLKRPPLQNKVTDTLTLAKEIYPGKRNSLDALCERLEVDNSQRTQHGALLDAELLAEVYVRMTCRQESLLIDLGEIGTASPQPTFEPKDLRSLNLPVLRATEAEAAEHERVLAHMEKDTKKSPVWTREAAA